MGKAALGLYPWISVCVLLFVHARSFHLPDVARHSSRFSKERQRGAEAFLLLSLKDWPLFALHHCKQSQCISKLTFAPTRKTLSTKAWETITVAAAIPVIKAPAGMNMASHMARSRYTAKDTKRSTATKRGTVRGTARKRDTATADTKRDTVAHSSTKTATATAIKRDTATTSSSTKRNAATYESTTRGTAMAIKRDTATTCSSAKRNAATYASTTRDTATDTDKRHGHGHGHRHGSTKKGQLPPAAGLATKNRS